MSQGKRSSSQCEEVGPLNRLTYLWRVVLMNIARIARPGDFANIAADLEFYRNIFRREAGRDLRDARIFEIGYGQRPFRLILLQSLGYDAKGVDADRPLYRIDLGAIVSIFKTNGILRVIKSLLRAVVFDRSEYKKLKAFIADQYGRTLSFNSDSMLVGNAGDPAVWALVGDKVDFIYSEDVFEHIAREMLPSVVDLMAEHLSDSGLAVITPMVFTGISGGHVIGWFPHKVNLENVRRGPAWGHLTGEAEIADTFLNKMTRREFRTLFLKRFDILQEEQLLEDLGRRHLTPERRQVLGSFDEEELFSNSVRFVLRKKTSATPPAT